MSAQRQVSMADVAALAGVSGQTVSRVANGSARVDPATRQRVEQAMATLGYTPNRAARALRTGQSRTIGLVVSALSAVGNFRMLQAISDAASSRGFALTLITVGEQADTARAFERLRAQGVDGAIVLNEATEFARGIPAPLGMRTVVVDCPPDERFAVVESDHAGGAARATRHLLAAGAATVWHVAGPESSYAARERVRGWRAALAEAGITPPELLHGEWTAASGFACGVELAERGAEAVFAGNDQMALGVLRAMAEAGRAVPGDVRVVGFDDVEDAAQFQPPLTTVRQDFDRLGALAVGALLDRLAGAEAPARTVVPTELVVRASA